MNQMDMKREKRRLIFMGIFIAVIIIIIVVIVAKAIGGGNDTNRNTQQEESDALYLPSNMMYIDDMYNGKMAIPKYDVPVSTVNTDQFVKSSDGLITYNKASLGVDVSEFQHEIDWHKVKESGINYAIIRLGYRGYTEGGLVMDAYFLQNLTGAIENGIDIGIYFFSQAINNKEAEEEAKYVIGQLSEYADQINYPIFFDWEPIQTDPDKPAARTANMTGEEISSCALAFCKTIEAAGQGFTAGVYFNKNMGYDTFDLELLKDYDFWYAEYQEKPSFYYNYHIWQYSESAQIPGVETNVDVNLSIKEYK